MIAWAQRGANYLATFAGCSLRVMLKESVAVALANGQDFGDEWPWLFEVDLPEQGGRLRGARETLADAQRAAYSKAHENAEVPDLLWNVG